MVNISQIMKVIGTATTSKGVTTMASEAVPKELGVLFRELKTAGSDLVEITHKVNTKGKSPYWVADIQVKDKNGNILDRLFASIADWTGGSYTVKWRNGSKAVQKAETKIVKPSKPANKDLKAENMTKKSNKDIPNDNKPTQPELPFEEGVKPSKPADKDLKAEYMTKKSNKDIPNDNKPTQPELPFEQGVKPSKPADKGLNAENMTKKSNKDIPNDNKPTQPELPFDNGVTPHEPIPGVPRPADKIIRFEPEESAGGLVPHPTQHIPNIRDFEIEGLLDSDIAKRLETIAQLQKDGRQALFDPMTGKPNVFWTFDRNEALDYFLKLLGRK